MNDKITFHTFVENNTSLPNGLNIPVGSWSIKLQLTAECYPFLLIFILYRSVLERDDFKQVFHLFEQIFFNLSIQRSWTCQPSEMIGQMARIGEETNTCSFEIFFRPKKFGLQYLTVVRVIFFSRFKIHFSTCLTQKCQNFTSSLLGSVKLDWINTCIRNLGWPSDKNKILTDHKLSSV